MTKWFRKPFSGASQPREEDDKPLTNGKAYLVPREQEEDDIEVDVERGQKRRFWKPSKREQQIATLQSGYVELMEVNRSIREYMDQQVLAQQRLLSAIEQLPEAAQRLEHVSNAVDQQTASLESIREQLGTHQQESREASSAVHGLGETVAQVDQSTKLATERMEALTGKVNAQEQLYRDSFQRLRRNLFVLAGLVLALAALGVGWLVYSSLRL